MPTLAELRRLLAMTPDGPARRRAGGTVEGMARAYLARGIQGSGGWIETAHELANAGCGDNIDREMLDLTDLGTAHALLTALALALGLDPGVGALAVQWTRDTRDRCVRWTVWGAGPGEDPAHFWVDFALTGLSDNEERIVAPLVANEPDPVKALGLAVAHVLSPLGDRAERVSGGDG